MSPLLSPRLWIVAAGTVIVPLDSSVNVAFPYIADGFGRPAPDLRLVVVTFILSSAALLLIGGRLGDLYGYRRIFRIGLVISIAALLLDAAAPSYLALLSARIGQGIGAALTLSCAPALTIGLFSEADRGKAIGAYAMIFAGSMALGPVVGGWLIDAWDWRAVFWYRAPLAAAALLGSIFLSSARAAVPGRTFDPAGAVLLGSALALTFISLNTLSTSAAAGAALGGLAILTGGGFVAHQLRSASPIIELRYFRSWPFSGLTVSNVLLNLSAFSVMMVVPFYLGRTAGVDAGDAGWVLAAYAGGVAATAWIAGQILNRAAAGDSAAPRLMRLSAIGIGAGLWLVSGLGPGQSLLAVAAAIGLVGAGLGLYQASFLYLVTGTLPPEDRGVAGSLAEVTRSMGNVGAATLMFEIFRTRSAAGGFEAGFQSTYVTAAAIAFAVLAVMLVPAIFQRTRS